MLTLTCLSFKNLFLVFFFFKQKTAYEMRISDWSSDVCSSDLGNYVIRWKDVPEIFSLTMHDRALQEAIHKNNSCLPPDIRRATLETAKTGLAGPEAQRSAEEALAEEDDEIQIGRASCRERVCQYV